MATSAKSAAGAMVAKVKEWHFLLTLVIGVSLVMGFGFETPGSRMDKIQTQLNSKSAALDTLQERLERSERLFLREIRKTQISIEKLMIGECLDRPARETQLQGLPCADLLNAARDRTAVVNP